MKNSKQAGNPQKLDQSRLNSVCFSIVALFCITIALIYMKPILIPFAVSVFLYFLVAPMIDLLQVRANLPRFISTVLTISIGILVASVLLFSFFISIKTFAPDAGKYQERLLDFSVSARDFVAGFGIDFNKDFIVANLSSIPLLDYVKTLTGSFVGLMGDSLLVLVILLFLIEGKDPKRKIKKEFLIVSQKITQYVRTKLATSFLTAILVWIVLKIVGVDLAGMIGVLTFLLNFIPSIGSLVAILLPLPIVLLEHGLGLPLAAAMLIPAIIQFSVGNILEPKLMGDSLDLHPVAQLFSLFFWGFIWGVGGMFLAVPITVVIKLLLEQFQQTKGIANFMAGRL